MLPFCGSYYVFWKYMHLWLSRSMYMQCCLVTRIWPGFYSMGSQYAGTGETFHLNSCVVLHIKWSRHRSGVAQRVGRGIALLFHDRGTRSGWVVSSTPRPHFTPGKDPVPILQEAGWASGPVWTGFPTGIRSRTVQPVFIRYTDWATGPTCYISYFTKCYF